MADLSSNLIIRLIDRLTAPARDVSDSIRRLEGAAAANARRMDAMRGRLVDAAGAAVALGAAIGAPIRSAIDFESAMADVGKVVSFETPEAFAEFGRDIREMSRHIPIAAGGLAEIVAAAGQAGIARDDLLRFTEEAAKIGVAFDISAGQAGEAVAKLMTGLGLSIDDATSLADAMNHLSNSQASSAAEILDVVRRVGAMGTQYGFTAEQTSAFASAMIAAGSNSDVAATSFMNMGRALTRGASATARQRNALGQLGMDATEVARSMQVDAVGTTRRVLEAISQLPAEMQASVSSDFFGDEARALGPLLTNLGLVDSSLALIADKSEYAGSAQAEFENRSKTTGNALQLFRNRVNDLSIGIGESLVPALNKLLDIVGPIASNFADLANRFPNVAAGVIGLTAAIVGLRVATIGISWAYLFVKGGILQIGLAAAKTVAAIKAAVPLIRIAFAAIRLAAFSSLLGIAQGLAWIGGAIAAVTGPVWISVAAIVGAVAAITIAIRRYWEPIREFTLGFAEVIGGALGEAWSALKGFAGRMAGLVVDKLIDFAAWLGFDEAEVRGVIDGAVETITSGFQRAVDFLKGLPAQLGDWLGDLFAVKDYSDEAEADFRQAGRDAAQAMVDAVKAKIDELVDWFRALPGRIVEAIGSIDFGSIIKWPEPPGWVRWLFGMDGAPSVPSAEPATRRRRRGGRRGGPFEGARASGGPVWPGAWLVGERGPELLNIPSAGHVYPADETRRILSAIPANDDGRPLPAVARPFDAYAGGASAGTATAAPGVVQHNTNTFQITVSMTSGDSADTVARKIADEIKQALDGTFADAIA